MGFPIYDYRSDIRNVLVTPQIRSRFLRMEPGTVASRHSHDLGHEIFLILEGRVEFTIDNETGILGPGQMCIALVDQVHQVRVIGDEPMTMYLSVTPHIQPTHTGRTEMDDPLPHSFRPSINYDVKEDLSITMETLLDHQVKTTELLAQSAQSSAETQKAMSILLKKAKAQGDENIANEARKAMWESLYPLFKRVYELAEAWNDFAPRATEPK